MKNLRRTALCIFLAIMAALSGTAVFYAETIYTNGDFTYTLLGDRNISIYAWDGEGELDLPEMLDVYKVNEIRNNCFFGREDLTQITLNRASYLNRIGVSAFKNSSITGELNIPPQLTNVATSAFQNCDSLSVLYYNAMSVRISSQCFYDCDALREVYIADGLSSIESFAFADCDSLEIIRIPDTVTAIHDTSFMNDSNAIIYCYTDSYAHQYAEDMGIEYVLIDAPAPTEPSTEPETEAPTEPETEAPTEPETEAPTDEPTLPTESGSYYLGDVDGNDIVDVIDATWIQRYNAYMTYPMSDAAMSHGDVDVDGEVTIYDATYIRRYTVYIDTPYPIGEYIEP